MEITEAIGHLTNDLERFATSGKASPKAIAFRQAVLNTVIDALNEAETKQEQQRTALQARIAALQHDLLDREARLQARYGQDGGPLPWSHFEGRAQRALSYLITRIDREEGRSISPEHATRERSMLYLVAREMEVLWNDGVLHAGAHRQAAARLEQLRQWCLVCGVDLEQFDSFPEHWLEHLPSAVVAADERRLADGLIDTRGVRRRAAYLNPNAVAYTVLSAIALDAQFREACAARGFPMPDSAPAWTWEPEEQNELVGAVG